MQKDIFSMSEVGILVVFQATLFKKFILKQYDLYSHGDKI